MSATARHTRWIHRALSVAAREADGGYRLGAIAVRGGKILGFGTNKFRNDPYHCPGTPRTGWSVHAEHACLKQVSAPAGATLYVARITRSGRPAMARPCQHCWAMIRRAGINKVIYTTPHGIVCERTEEVGEGLLAYSA